MPAAPLPPDETTRLLALHGLGLLDTLPEGSYEQLLRIAAALCGTPMGTVTLLDADRQWFKARVGVASSETPRDHALCAWTILEADGLMVVEDARADPRFADNPLVTEESGIRFYAGTPLRLADGSAVGTLCVMDRVPRTLGAGQREALRALGAQVVKLFELAQAKRLLEHHLEERAWYERQLDLQREALRARNRELQALSDTDALTALPNRRGFHARLDLALGSGAPYALAIVDIDHFKRVNDVHGHAVGDQVLAEVAAALARAADGVEVGRFGGEEFVVLLQGPPGTEAARLEAMRRAVEAAPTQVPVTVSIGWSPAAAGEPPEAAFARADEAMYAAKRDGRNRVVLGAGGG